MKLLAAAAPLVLCGALLAGCGGGDTTTLIERTVTQTVPAEAKGGGKVAAGGSKATKSEETSATGAEAGTTKPAEEPEAEEPTRILHLQTFRTPTGNIGCEMFDGGARCDIRKRSWAPPRRPASCSKQVDYGQGLAVSETGQASFVCAGDTALESGAAVLAYGSASQVGGSECVSRAEGVSCVNPAGHGFFISIKSYQVY